MGLSGLDIGDAREILGLDRHGLYVVENDTATGWNEKTIRSLRSGGRMIYAAPLFSSNGETVAIIPEIVIRTKPGIAMEEVQTLCETAGCTIRKQMEFTTQEYLLEVLGPDAEAVFTAVERLGQAPEVEWVCPNTAVRPKLSGQFLRIVPVSSGQMRTLAAGDPCDRGVFPNDEYFPNQWHLHNTGQSDGTPGADIRAPEAWEITTGDPNTVVAVIDTGVDSIHSDLVGNLVQGYDFYDSDDQPVPSLDYPSNAHGTACAGLIAAQGNNSIGVSGVAWTCKVMPIRWESFAGDGKETWVTDADIAEAIRWAAEHGADILSNSWGLRASLPASHSAIVDVTHRDGIGRNGKGCLVFSCAMNYDEPVSHYPQKYSETTVVGATDHNDMRCYYSNYGPELDICAPSGPGHTEADWLRTKGMGWTWTTDISGAEGWNMSPFDPNVLNYTGMGGTSGACPVAAGVAALILSIEPELTNDEVRHFLERSAKDLGDPGWDDYYGWGRVDARAALDMVLAKRCDLNDDWQVDEQDLAILTVAIDNNDLSADIAPATKRDGLVDANDLELLTQYLGTEIPELGLIAHWKLDEAEGLIACDSAGEHHDATVIGDALWQPEGGMIDGSLGFDGIDDYVSTPFVLNPADGPFSVFVWVNGGSPGQVILSQTAGADWLMADPSAGTLMTTISPPVSRTPIPPLISDYVIADGQWHRIGFVYDGKDRILYADGVEVARDTQNSPKASSEGFHIGCDGKATVGTFWSGLIDDVRIYDRVVQP